MDRGKRRKLGQHFLIDETIANQIIDAASLTKSDLAIEIGPGNGILTYHLAENAGRVLAIEMDMGLFKNLSKKINDYKNIELVNANALKYDFPNLIEMKPASDGKVKVVSNIPYSISKPLILKLITFRDTIDEMYLMVQKEVAERIVAKPGNRDYGVMTIATQLYSNIRILFDVPASAFRPKPRVVSSVIAMELLKYPKVEIEDEKLFFQLIKKVFAHRRKTIYNALKASGLKGDDISHILNKLYIEPGRRPETLSLEEFAELAERSYCCG